MTTLTRPVVGVAEGHDSDHNECGKLNAIATVQIALPGKTFWVPDGASAPQMITAIKSACPGVRIATFNVNAADLVKWYIVQGWYVLAQVYCNSNAVPVPSSQATADHWITLYSDDNSPAYYQCWDASYRSISNLRQCSHQNDIHWHVLVKLPSSAPQPQPTPPQEETVREVNFEGPGNRLDTFELADNGQVYHKWSFDLGSNWGNEPVGIGGLNPVKGITGERRADNGFDLYAETTDGHEWHAGQGGGGSTWSWQILP